MGDILRIHHPRPMIVLPRGAKAERVALATMDTTLRAPVVSDGQMSPLHEGTKGAYEYLDGHWREDTALPLFSSEGRLWHRVSYPDRCRNANYRIPLTQAMFADCLSQAPSARGAGIWQHGIGTMVRHFLGTPLLAWSRDARDGWKGNPDRGSDEPPRGTVVDDLGDQARVALVALFERDVRFCGGQVYAAFDGVCHVLDPSGEVPSQGLRAVTSPRHALLESGQAYCVEWGRREMGPFSREAAGIQDGCLVRERHALMDLPRGEAIPRDVLAVVNEAPRRLIEWAAYRNVTPYGTDLAPLLPWAALGTIGAVPESEAAECLALAARLAGEGWTGPSPRRRLARALVAYAERVGLPVLAASAPGMAPEDEDALSGMAP